MTDQTARSWKSRLSEFLVSKVSRPSVVVAMAKTKRGVNFVGYRTWRRAKFIRKYSLFKFRRAAKRGKADSVISLLGHAKHSHSLGFMWRTIREVNPDLVRKLPPKVRRFYPARPPLPTKQN